MLQLLQNGVASGSAITDRKRLEDYLTEQERPWWFQTARDVRESDEGKVRDYKEDIDTLLVIGALFSAVITALMIESYKNLSPDPAELTVQILLHISQQLNSYTLNGSFMNNTIPPFIPEPFTPSETTVVANATWFASLMISLIAASYGMLVKQWLREYLANRDSSPLTRLRIRCFRYPALAKWKVFEVIAILPLLLQLALGIFLVGMCYFASSIHPTVQWTVIPLVAVWAALLIASTFAPVFSARCPYKTTFLKGIMVKLRRLRFAIACMVVPFRGSKLERPPEEEDFAAGDMTDFQVLIQVDLTQMDDALIAPALVDLGRQQSGLNLVLFIIEILRHRFSNKRKGNTKEITPGELGEISEDLIGYLPEFHNISTQLFKAIAETLARGLRKQTHDDSSVDQIETWMGVAFQLLLLASRHSWATPLLGDILEDYLLTFKDTSIIERSKKLVPFLELGPGDTPIVVQTIIMGWAKTLSGRSRDDLPLKIDRRKVSNALPKITRLFYDLICSETPVGSSSPAWSKKIKFAWRFLLGEMDDGSDTLQDIVHELGQIAPQKDQLIQELLAPILSQSSDLKKHHTHIVSYILRVLDFDRRTLVSKAPILNKDSRSTLNECLTSALKNIIAPVIDDRIVSDAALMLLFWRGCFEDKTIETMMSLYEDFSRAMVDGFIGLFYHEETLPCLESTIMALLRMAFSNTEIDPVVQFETDPWVLITQPITAAFLLPDIVIQTTAKILSRVLGSPHNRSGHHISWMVKIILSSSSEGYQFQPLTLTALKKLLQSHSIELIYTMPRVGNEKDRTVELLWLALSQIFESESERFTFIRDAWRACLSAAENLPSNLSTNGRPDTSRTLPVVIPISLFRRYAEEQKKKATGLFLDTPHEFRTNQDIVESFINDHLEHCRRANASRSDMSQCLNELQLVVQNDPTNIPFRAIRCIAANLNRVEDPEWPQWLKILVMDDILSPNAQPSDCDNSTHYLQHNATETISLLASHHVKYLDSIPANIFASPSQMIEALHLNLVRYPEPLRSSDAEACLMRLFVHSKIEQPISAFYEDKFTENRLLIQKTSMSLVLRVLNYHLKQEITLRNAGSLIDLSRLEASVWEDVLEVATKIIGHKYVDGGSDQLAPQDWEAIRMDAIMILLAESPHPFPTSRSYEILEQELFFHWDQHADIHKDIRTRLEEKRRQRVEEGRLMITRVAPDDLHEHPYDEDMWIDRDRESDYYDRSRIYGEMEGSEDRIMMEGREITRFNPDGPIRQPKRRVNRRLWGRKRDPEAEAVASFRYQELESKKTR